MLLTESTSEKKQFNVKLYKDTIDYIEHQARANNTTATNVVRHALNLTKRINELSREMDNLEAQSDLYRGELLEAVYTRNEMTEEVGNSEDGYDVSFVEISADSFDSPEEYRKFTVKVGSELTEANLEADKAAREAGYALREKYADVIPYIPTLPDAPMPF